MRISVCNPTNSNEPSFYFPNLNRNQAEALLAGQENGVFLLRDSVYFAGRLTLSFAVRNKYEHYIIEKFQQESTELVSLNKKRWFKSVNEMIKYYQMNQDDLGCLLTVGLSSSNLVSDSQHNLSSKQIIKICELKFMEWIGSGEFSDVRKGEWDNKLVAIKQIKDGVFSLRNFLHEANVMSLLSHENIVNFYGVSIQTRVLIITEYMSNGTLLDYLRSRGRNMIDWNELIKYSFQVCCAFEYLETKQIVHCDLCASNVLLNSNKVAKVSDFGLSISLKNENKLPSLQSSNSLFSSCASLPFVPIPENHSKQAAVATAAKIRIKWTAPECFNGRAFSVKSDVWSFSIFLYEVFSFGRTPYPRIPTEHIKDFIYKGNRMKAPEDCPNVMYEIMNQCWRMRPDERPSFAILRKKLTNILFA